MASRKTKKGSRGQFRDETRAQVFAWDRAVCALTGANLWILDYGLSALEQEDWADHIRPVARGGKHVAGNGICTSASANFTKSANGRANEYWFIGGRPTYRFFADVGRVPESIAIWLRRDVCPRDWYFNRSLRNVLIAVSVVGCDITGYKRHEDSLYYPRAALRFLEEFRAAWTADQPAGTRFTRRAVERDWQDRGLLRDEPWREQAALLDLLELRSAEDIAALVARVAKRYSRNFSWVEKLDRWTTTCDAAKGAALLAAMSRDVDVSPLVKDLVSHNVAVLSGLSKPDPAELARGTIRRCAQYS